MVRPSFKSTTSASSVTITFCTLASAVKVVIPTSQQCCSIILDHLLDATDFSSTKAPAVLQSNGVEPKLSFIGIPFNVDVWRLVTITGIKEKPVWPDS